MTPTQKTITTATAEFLFLSLLGLSVPLILAVDLLIFGSGVKEASLTETIQGALLFACALRFVVSAWHRPQSRGFLVLVAGFFSCMFVREMDGFLDQMVFHGFWLLPAALLAVGSVTCAMAHRETILAPMANFIATRSHFSIFFGLIILLVFSRSFGSGSLLWKQIMGEDYRSLFKAALQEGLELLGYLFISYGTLLLPRLTKRTSRPWNHLVLWGDSLRGPRPVCDGCGRAPRSVDGIPGDRASRIPLGGGVGSPILRR